MIKNENVWNLALNHLFLLFCQPLPGPHDDFLRTELSKDCIYLLISLHGVVSVAEWIVAINA